MITSSTSSAGIPARSMTAENAFAEQLVRVRVLVVALLRVAAPDRCACSLDDDDFPASPVLHRCASDCRAGRFRHPCGELRRGEKFGASCSGYVTSLTHESTGGERPRYGLRDASPSRWASRAPGRSRCGLAACVMAHGGDVVMWARSEDSARRARKALSHRHGQKLTVTTDRGCPRRRHAGRGGGRRGARGEARAAPLPARPARRTGRCSPARRPRSTSPSWRPPAVTPRASSACTSSTR